MIKAKTFNSLDALNEFVSSTPGLKPISINKVNKTVIGDLPLLNGQIYQTVITVFEFYYSITL